MGKRSSFIILLLTGLAILSGFLLSKASLVGKTGISIFYRQYKFLKIWWQGALVVFIAWILLFILQGWIERKYPIRTSRLIHISAIILAAVGLFFTYQDFRNTLSHRLLGERFHIGAYLFWLGWMIISLFYLTNPKASKVLV